MSNEPQPNPPTPQPPQVSALQRHGKLLFVVGTVVVVASILVAALAIHSSHSRDAAEDKADNAGNLPAWANQSTTTTTTDANGNVSTVSEDPTTGSGNGAEGSMQHVSLADPAVGIQDAMSLNIPAGWQFHGQVVRNISCSPGDAFPQMQTSSADGAYSLTIMTPFFTSSAAPSFDMRNCGVVAPLTSSADILTRYVLPAIRPGVQASTPEPVPGVEQFLQNTNQSGNGMMMSGDDARVKLSYDKNGTAVDEYIVGLTTVLRRQGMQGGTSSTIVEIYTAPAGKLDAFFQQAESTMELTPNPQWQQRDAQMTRQMAAQSQQQGDQQRATILQNGQDGGAAGRAMLAQTRSNIQATGQASMNNAARSEAARHYGAVGTADYVGNRPTQTYFFCNSSGGHTTNNNPNPPGPGWYPCN
jgi:hypothetical protein